MLTEERFAIILETVRQKRSVRVTELCALLNASVSTVRRDINTLAEMGKLVKVHGGAIALNESSFSAVEKDMTEKAQLFTEEKEAIARYAASLVDEDDFVYIDAGTTTEKMIDYLPQKRVMFVTNGFIHARKLAQRGFRVYIPGGELKLSTEAIIGTECILTLNNYNFTKCFMGTNGISVHAGFSTHDISEGSVKTAVIDNSIQTYVLSDHSKFGKVTSVTFAQLNRGQIITDRLPDKTYSSYTSIKEVM